VLELLFAETSDLGRTIRRPDSTIAVAVAQGGFPHLNWMPEPLRKLAGENVAGRSVLWKKQRRKGQGEQRSPAPGAHELSRGEMTMGLVHRGPCLRTMDQERWSTVSHTV